MDRRAAWVLGVIFGGLFLCLFGFLLILTIAVRSDDDKGSLSSGGDRVGVVEISGQIDDSKKTIKELDAFAEDEHIKAIIVRIDSPGGAVGPSQEIYDRIRKLRAKKKIFASMGSLAASGGFYIAMAAEKVYANPGTLTGSIGVIFQLPNVQGLMKWAGVEMNTITAGKLKDSGSPFKPMTAEEREYFSRMLEDVHAQFIQAVADGRGLKVEEVTPVADGRVFTGRQAKEMKLVDELGGLSDAVEAVAKLAGIKGEPKTEYPKQKERLLRELLGQEADSMFQGAAAKVLGGFGGVGLQYRMPLVEQ
jgi:protease IV